MSTIQRIISQYRIKSDFASLTLPKSTEDYAEIASITDFGILCSVGILFNNKDITVKCVIDDEFIFEISLETLKGMFTQWQANTKNDLPLHFDDNSDFFSFKPSYPIMFNKSIVLYARSSSKSTKREFISAVVEYTKE